MSEVRLTAKRDRFVRLAEARVAKAIKSIRIIGNLANKNNYEYTERDVNRIYGALQSEINDLKAQFKVGTSNNDVQFRLTD